MILLHELVHHLMGLEDPPNQFEASRLGAVGQFMNLIRRQLGLTDMRLVYGPIPDASYNSVIPFSSGNVILPID